MQWLLLANGGIMNIGMLLLYLSIGTAAMLVPIMIQGAWYQVKSWKRVLITVLLTIAGTLGTFLLYFVENGKFGGTSFFGAIFLVPLLFIPVASVLKVPYGRLMDLCAPAECAMLVVMKIQCLLTGCCGGRLVHFNGVEFVFPSQIAELINALILCVLLLLMARKIKNPGKVFPCYMILYGVTRFVLNLFRNVKNMAILPIPAGNFWAIVSIAVGLIWLLVLSVKANKQPQE